MSMAGEAESNSSHHVCHQLCFMSLILMRLEAPFGTAALNMWVKLSFVNVYQRNFFYV